jgi:predicted membrane protein
MRINHPLLSLTHIFILLIFLGFGIFFMSIAWSSTLNYSISKTILLYPEKFLPIGIICIFLSIIFSIAFYAMHKNRYLQVKMKQHSFFIDTCLIKSHIKKYWNDSFPDRDIETDVVICKNQEIEIIVYFQRLEEEAISGLLEKFQKDISKLLSYHFDYKKDFIFTLSYI